VLSRTINYQAGRDLRLKQEYFFVACAIADIVRRYRKHQTTSPSSGARTRSS